MFNASQLAKMENRIACKECGATFVRDQPPEKPWATVCEDCLVKMLNMPPLPDTDNDRIAALLRQILDELKDIKYAVNRL